jgi:hypothetical protein
MKTIFNLYAIALAGVMAMGMVACNDGGTEVYPEPVTIEIAPASLAFAADGTAAAGASVTVTGAAWSATSSDGWITITPASGADGGSFTVAVTANTGDDATLRNGSVTVTSAGGEDTKTVAVSQAAPVHMAVTGVALDETSAHLIMIDEAKKTITLTATVQPANASNPDVNWSSDDEDIATVVDGLVTAVAPGNATITVTSDENDQITAECEITVTEHGFIIADANLFGTYDWDTAQTACPEGWRVPKGGELQSICRSYHSEGAENTIPGWPVDMPYWSSDTAPGMLGGETGARINFHSPTDPDCTVAGAMLNSQAGYVRCIQDVELTK